MDDKLMKLGTSGRKKGAKRKFKDSYKKLSPPRPVKLGKLDMTRARNFLDDPALLQELEILLVFF